jgi:hypothetical protein
MITNIEEKKRERGKSKKVGLLSLREKIIKTPPNLTF